MLTYEEAKKIGVNACIDKLGRDFVLKYRDTSCAGYGKEDDYAFCYVGVDDRMEPEKTGKGLVLDDSPDSKFPYLAMCNVWYENGKIEFLDCVLPDGAEKNICLSDGA